MKRALLPLLFCLSVAPALAQDTSPTPPGNVDEGVSLMQEGAKLLLKGLMSNMEPAMQDMGRALSELQPAMTDLLAMMGDVTKYHAPEMLENGDIIIRHKTPAELAPKAPEIDL
jgi:hypothetical protein